MRESIYYRCLFWSSIFNCWLLSLLRLESSCRLVRPGEWHQHLQTHRQSERESGHLSETCSLYSSIPETYFNNWGWSQSIVSLTTVARFKLQQRENATPSGVSARRTQSINEPDVLMWCSYWKKGWIMVLQLHCDIRPTVRIDDFIMISSLTQRLLYNDLQAVVALRNSGIISRW